MDYLAKFGLTSTDIDKELVTKEEVINEITSSGLLYRRTMRNILLNRFNQYFNKTSLNSADLLLDYFPKKDRKKKWNEFRETFEIKLPGLRLSRISQIVIVIFVVGFIFLIISLFTKHIDLLIALKYSGLSSFPFVALFFVFIGIILAFGSNRLPAHTFDDLTDQIIQINNIELLTNDKILLRNILMKELDR